MSMRHAVMHNDVDEIEQLLLDGADIEDCSNYATTALLAAVNRGYTRIVELLLKAGANAYVESVFKDTPIIVASFEGHADIVELLLLHGVPGDFVDYSGYTPMYCAFVGNHMNVVNVLVRFNIQVDDRTHAYLSRVVNDNEIEIKKRLLELESSNVQRFVSEIAKRGHHEIVQYLKEHTRKLQMRHLEIVSQAVVHYPHVRDVIPTIASFL